MSYSIVTSRTSGYPTSTVIRVDVKITVEAAGNYSTKYDLYNAVDPDNDNDNIYITSSTGSTVTMSANETRDVGHKTFSGLTPSTWYLIRSYLVNSRGTVVATKDRLLKTADSEATLKVIYYDGSSSDTVTSTSSITVKSASRSGWTFVGWSTEVNTESISYEAGDIISVGSSNQTIRLYAVYKKESTITFYYITSSTGNLSTNTRPKIQYRVQVSETEVTEDHYNAITLPTFTSSNSSITTSEPDRTWSVIGWHSTSFAMEPDYSPGQLVASNRLGSFLYAVYSNECSITYNSNGGSGSMSKQTGTGYYSASGDYTGVTFSIKDCTFTPPIGKTFDSWNVKSDGSGTKYTTVITTSYNVTLYAIWKIGRPSNWSWSTTGISKGSSMAYTQSGATIIVKPLTATEWLAFMNRVKEFYTYKGKTVDSTYWHRAVNGVESGSSMTATQANGARYLISQLSPPTSVPASVSSGTVITAAFINGLKNSLNSIV